MRLLCLSSERKVLGVARALEDVKDGRVWRLDGTAATNLSVDLRNSQTAGIAGGLGISQVAGSAHSQHHFLNIF